MIKSQKALIPQPSIFSRLNADAIVNVTVLVEEFGVSICMIQMEMNSLIKSKLFLSGVKEYYIEICHYERINGEIKL